MSEAAPAGEGESGGQPNLVIRFAGLVMHSPKADPADPSQPADEYSLLLPEARGTVDAGAYPPRHKGEPSLHVPYLRYEMAQTGIVGGPSLSDGIVRIDRHTIRFDGLADSGPVEWSEVPRQLADLAQVLPGIAIDPDLFGESPPVTLAGRVDLTGGKFLASPAGEMGIFEFRTHRHGEPGHTCRMSNWIEWKAPLADTSVQVHFGSFEGGDEIEPLKLDGQGRDVVLRVANLCQTGFMDWAEFREVNPRVIECDQDFAWFYRLCPESDRPKSSDLMPLPFYMGGGGAAGDLPDCGGAFLVRT